MLQVARGAHRVGREGGSFSLAAGRGWVLLRLPRRAAEEQLRLVLVLLALAQLQHEAPASYASVGSFMSCTATEKKERGWNCGGQRFAQVARSSGLVQWPGGA